MVEHNDIHDDLITDYLTGNISDPDRFRLEKWIACSVENRKYFEQFLTAWLVLGLGGSRRKYDEKEGLDAFRARYRLSEKPSKQKRAIRLSYSGVNPLWRVAAVVLFILSSSITLKLLDFTPADHLASPMNVVEVTRGSKSRITLPDGSTAWVSSGSILKYPQDFGKAVRRIEIEGEGYFEVEHNLEHPFIVASKGVEVKVLGTKFSVKNFEDEYDIRVTLFEGSLRVVLGNQDVLLEPGFQAMLDKRSDSLKVWQPVLMQDREWIYSNILFDDEPLEYIVKLLERNYNVKITIANPELKERVFGGGFAMEGHNIDDIMKMLARYDKINYRITGHEITLY